MKFLELIFVTTILMVTRCTFVSSHEHTTRIDVFHELKEKLNVTTDALPALKVKKFFHDILHRFSCEVNGSALREFEAETTLNSCDHDLCVNVTSLFTLIGGDTDLGLTEEEFHSAATVALYFLSRGLHPCKATLSPAQGQLTVKDVHHKFVVNISTDNLLSESQLDTFLHSLHDIYAGEEHHHEEDSSHTRKRREAEHLHEDEHDGHGDEEKPSVIEAKCLSPDSIFYYLHAEEDSVVTANSSLEDIATYILYQMYEGAAIEETCRMLPKKSDFVKNLISRLMGQGTEANLTQAGLHLLMENLDILPAEDDHGHDHDHGAMRKRRSIHEISLHRVKRQTVATDSRCYTAEELSAVFEAGETMTSEELTQLSPALIYQKLYAQCQHTSTGSNQDTNRWWYGTVTVAIICLCSLAGVILIPCAARRAYGLVMGLFIGLAVGTLTGDALLHLIPATMGAHEHGEEDGHDHGHGNTVVVEEYLWFALVTMGGIYLFFLIETFFARFLRADGHVSHGHSHSYQLDDQDNNIIDSEKEGKNSAIDGQGNLALCIMIILGDAVHNFADGLAIGASFSNSNSLGIATGIAVFCHELPHELGDFAVLLKNGFSVKKAIFWNLTSALTAFIGLYVSLAVTTDTVAQSWIFAVAAGMFLYIALTDLLPDMVSTQKTGDNKVFLLNNLGILLGAAIMLVIAIFEEHIKI